MIAITPSAVRVVRPQMSAARSARTSAVKPARSVRARATENESDMLSMSDQMNDVMSKAAGGSTVPKWVPDVPELQSAIKILSSENTSLGSMILREKYGETLYRNSGFTELAELINGRCAMIGFVACVGATFKGDFLVQFAKAPLGTILVMLVIMAATLVPRLEPTAGYIPAAVVETTEKMMEGMGFASIFSEKAEQVNGRAAMMGLLVFVITATVF